MNAVAAAVFELRRHGAVVEKTDGGLRLKAPTPLPAAAVESVKALKTVLATMLADDPNALERFDEFEERAALIEFTANTPRDDAERAAWIQTFDETYTKTSS